MSVALQVERLGERAEYMRMEECNKRLKVWIVKFYGVCVCVIQFERSQVFLCTRIEKFNLCEMYFGIDLYSKEKRVLEP